MTIKLLLLKSGEDVIADITEMTAGKEKRVVGYFLKKPCVVTSRNPEETDEIGKHKAGLEVSLFPWLPLAKEETIPMTADWLITMVDPIDKLKTMYLEDVIDHGRHNNKGDSTSESSVSDK